MQLTDFRYYLTEIAVGIIDRSGFVAGTAGVRPVDGSESSLWLGQWLSLG